MKNENKNIGAVADFLRSRNVARLWRHKASNIILGSRPWPFGVTWRHRSRDRWMHCIALDRQLEKQRRDSANIRREWWRHLATATRFNTRLCVYDPDP